MKTLKSNFKCVYFNTIYGDNSWEAVVTIKGIKYRRTKLNTDREAALEVDKILIKHGKNPINILKRKM